MATSLLRDPTRTHLEPPLEGSGVEPVWGRSCRGQLLAAYARRADGGRQRWVRIGRWCLRCGAFLADAGAREELAGGPGSRRPGRR